MAARTTSVRATPTWRATRSASGAGHNAIAPGLKNRFGGSIGGPINQGRASSSSTGNRSGRRLVRRQPVLCRPLTCQQLSGNGDERIGYRGMRLQRVPAIRTLPQASICGNTMLIYNNTGNAGYNAAFAANVIPTAADLAAALQHSQLLQTLHAESRSANLSSRRE